MILFVCVENTFRSVIAEAIFNHHAPSDWRGESAGVKPAAEINPVAVQLLGEIEIKIAEKKPRLVTSQLVTDASRIITFGCID
jgi:protein-tyrosine-phosphatase